MSDAVVMPRSDANGAPYFWLSVVGLGSSPPTLITPFGMNAASMPMQADDPTVKPPVGLTQPDSGLVVLPVRWTVRSRGAEPNPCADSSTEES